VKIVARAEQLLEAPKDWRLTTGEGVSIVPIPYYIGFVQFLQKYRAITKTLCGLVNDKDAYLFRVPSVLASIMIPILRSNRHPFGLEVVGDPYEVFAPGTISHPLRRYFRWNGMQTLRRQCQQADVVTYVTSVALQKRYPPSPSAYSTYFSDIEMQAEALIDQPRTYANSVNSVRLITVGSLQQPYKGVDILIDAIKICRQTDLRLKCVIVGDGKYRNELQNQVQKANLEQQIRFIGALPAGKAVRDALDAADLFVLSSRTEGLPRALIEAMARGLPCIATNVGGIPELLPQEDMVPPNDAQALAEKIQAFINYPERMTQSARLNLKTAAQYSNVVLDKRRRKFFQALLQKTNGRIESIPVPIMRQGSQGGENECRLSGKSRARDEKINRGCN
jgi:glycosyltransferase involved in cell wall biosynthesis